MSKILSILLTTWTIGLSGTSFAKGQSVKDEDEDSPIEWTVGAELYLGLSLTAGWRINDKWAAEIFGETARATLFVPCGGGDKGYHAGWRMRRFIGDSLNFNIANFIRDEHYDCIPHTRSLGVSASFGNRWELNNFYLGMEWLGLGIDRSFSFMNQKGVPEQNQPKLILLRFAVGTQF